jgi:hypothetical protein
LRKAASPDCLMSSRPRGTRRTKHSPAAMLAALEDNDG